MFFPREFPVAVKFLDNPFFFGSLIQFFAARFRVASLRFFLCVHSAINLAGLAAMTAIPLTENRMSADQVLIEQDESRPQPAPD